MIKKQTPVSKAVEMRNKVRRTVKRIKRKFRGIQPCAGPRTPVKENDYLKQLERQNY
jgi:hypothetical protein